MDARGFLGFMRSAHSESDGSASWSRLAGSALVLGIIVWISVMLWRDHVHPDISSLVVLMSAPYGLNLTHKGVTAIFGKTNGTSNANGSGTGTPGAS
jgi:hypothetical protein